MKISLIFPILLILCCVAFSYRNIRCPSQSEWRFRSSWVCNGTETNKYTCLYNAIRRKYEESCKFPPVISGNGSQYVISVYPNSEPCRNNDRYQPFSLGSNGSSDCVFQKSTCSEEGQILFHHGSPTKDLSCRCNFQKGFGFVNEIPNKCDCIPSNEDCSCYMKNNQCLPRHRLISDYTCLHEDNKKHITKCPEMGPDSFRKKTPYLRQLSIKELQNIGCLSRRSDCIGLICVICVCIVYAIFALILIITNKIPGFCSIEICPYNLEVTGEGGFIRISWSESEKVPTIDILNYNIYYTYNGIWKLKTVTGNKDCLLNGLKPAETYRFKVSVRLKNSIESKCSKERSFHTGLPATPICGAPFGNDGSIEVPLDTPNDTWINIEEYLIKFSNDKWVNVHEERVPSNSRKYVIKDAKEDATYRFRICSCSNSVNSKTEGLIFSTHHNTLEAGIKYSMNYMENKGKVSKEVLDKFVKTINGLNGTQDVLQTSEREGSIVVTVTFISEGCDEKLLHDTLKNAFQKGMSELYTKQFQKFWLKRLNDPSPPQLVKASIVNNVVRVSWKKSYRTFFKIRKYVVEYTKDEWKSKDKIDVSVDNKTCFIENLLPSDKIQVKVYTCICHSIRSSPSREVTIAVKERLDSAREVLVNLQKEPEFIGITNSTQKVNEGQLQDLIFEHAQCAAVQTFIKISLEEEGEGMWLFDVLESIGMKDEYRRTCQQTGITCEILLTFKALITSNNYGSSQEATVTQLQNDGCEKTSQKEYVTCNFPDIFENIETFYNMGSTFEATVTPDEPHDLDFMECQELFTVIEDISNAEKNKFSLLIVREPETPAGYVKLQLVGIDKPLTSTDWPSVKHMFQNLSHCFKTDKLKRLVLCDFFMVNEGGHMFSKRLENKHAVKNENFYGLNADTVISYRGKTWPSMANEWLTRSRLYGWPTIDMIQDLKSLGFFVVRKGHPFSSEMNLEWRISLTLQERQLVYNLTNVQHKCYVFLKMINREIIHLECITSYHWKTCLFYMIEGNKENIWEKRLLFHCVKLCIKQMLKWVKNGVCPNYFIPAENLFYGRLTDSLKTTSEKKLVELLKIGFGCLLSVASNNIRDFLMSRGSIRLSELYQAKYKEAYIKALAFAKTTTFRTVHSVFNRSILANYFEQTDDVHSKFINFLWFSKDLIQNIRTIFEHRAHEVKSAQALLLPCINMCLASSLSAFALNMTQFDTRDILLLGSLSYLFIHGDLSGRLKLISIFLAAEMYADCEWHLDQLYEEDIKCIPSVCVCRHCTTDSYVLSQKNINTFAVSTCLSFLPIELPIIPDAMKYEMFGTSIHKIDTTNIVDPWHYTAVVDCNIYYFLLKYLIKKKLRKVREYNKAKNEIKKLIHGENVRHRDVAFNLMASICFSEFNTPDALKYLTCSWKIMISSDLCFMVLTEKMKRKQYLYNAANIHALVILYKTWYGRLQSSVHFCFQCFCKSETRLQKCSRCKISTYCDNYCQRKNWKIHKETCKMARKHHILCSTSVVPFADL